MSIPKVIHYFWFGNGQLSDINVKCINSWRKYCPDYEIKLWNEDNFDIHSNSFMEAAYNQKKWALITDYARFYILYKYGGIYIETDSEILRPLEDSFLKHKAFFARAGEDFTLSILGMEAGHPVGKYMCDYYDTHNFIKDGIVITVNTILTNTLRDNYDLPAPSKDIEVLKDDIAIYPPKYFYTDWEKGRLNDKNSYIFHYGEATWTGEEYKTRQRINNKCVSIFGKKLGWQIGRVVFSLSYYGFFETIRRRMRHLKNK